MRRLRKDTKKATQADLSLSRVPAIPTREKELRVPSQHAHARRIEAVRAAERRVWVARNSPSAPSDVIGGQPWKDQQGAVCNSPPVVLHDSLVVRRRDVPAGLGSRGAGERWQGGGWLLVVGGSAHCGMGRG